MGNKVRFIYNIRNMTRRHPERKVLRLAECVSVVKLPPHAEACPGENMAAFCVEMEDKRLVFAADRESLSGFKVIVLQSEASSRCGLKGQYWLKAGDNSLSLHDIDDGKTVMEWPYKLLRRYGRDKMLFSIEAGRRCESGPGTFNFESWQSDEILQLIESSIRQQKSLTIAGEKHSPHSPRSRSPRSPLPKRPQSFPSLDTEGINSTNLVDTDSPNVYMLSNLVQAKPTSLSGSTEAVYADPANLISSKQMSFSDPPGLIEPVYSTPTVSLGKQESVYAQPDLIRSHNSINRDSLQYNDDLEIIYSDPLDVIHQKPVRANPTNTMDSQPIKTKPKNDKYPETVYSEVYDHFNINSNKISEQKFEEPIYSVPEVVMTAQNHFLQQTQNPTEPIYSRIIKPPQTPQENTEIVSEDLGLI
ncbi:hypothetical protein DNTS_004624 [Danionella cerebrum]|uniref:IRS-type PTB domain-containing protein n=1 Tax=Danionella cerebrum TaxID=2873325 RepID=A0A553QWZ1_9TELE|nr:hypothetical protein DNTS_004624 [Danionella translucida]